jgi:hypothetical protein
MYVKRDQWDAVFSRITGTIYRGTERISSNALLNVLDVGPDPVLRQKMAKRRSSLSPGFPQVADFRSQTGPKERAGTLSHAFPLREQLRTPTSYTVTHDRLGFGASPNLPQSSSASQAAEKVKEPKLSAIILRLARRYD